MSVHQLNEYAANQSSAAHAVKNVIELVAALDDQPIEGVADPAFGNMFWQTLISSDKTSSNGVVLGVATFPAHGFLNLHRHTQTEYYFCLKGSGVVMLDGQPLDLTPGSAIFIPSGAEHGVTAGPDGLTFVYGFGADAFSEIDYKFSANK